MLFAGGHASVLPTTSTWRTYIFQSNRSRIPQTLLQLGIGTFRHKIDNFLPNLVLDES